MTIKGKTVHKLRLPPGDNSTATLGVWGVCGITVLTGSQLGSRLMAERMKSRAVKRVFGCVLLSVAALIIIKDVLGL